MAHFAKPESALKRAEASQQVAEEQASRLVSQQQAWEFHHPQKGPQPGQAKQQRRRDKQHVPAAKGTDAKKDEESTKKSRKKIISSNSSLETSGGVNVSSSLVTPKIKKCISHIDGTHSESIETRGVKRKQKNKSDNPLKRGITTEIDSNSCAKSNNDSMRTEKIKRKKKRNSFDSLMEVADELADKNYNVPAKKVGLSNGAEADGSIYVIDHDIHSEANDLKNIKTEKHKKHKKKRKETVTDTECGLSDEIDTNGVKNVIARGIHSEANEMKNIKVEQRVRRKRKKENAGTKEGGLSQEADVDGLNNLNAYDVHFESDDLKSIKSRRRSKESGNFANQVISDMGLEGKSSLESLNTDELMPLVEEETCTITQDALRSCARKKLLILDLNGLLCDVVRGAAYSRLERKRVGKCLVFKRPFCDDFLKFCCERFDIGVWSSRKKINVDGVVNYIMWDIRNKLLFCWDASHCTNTGFMTIGDNNKPLVLKEMKKIWSKEGTNLPWNKGDYSPSNTLLIDDSPYKALCNPPHTAIFPKSYHYSDENDNSLGPGGDLRVYLEGLALADDVQCYVREHPFGQRAITTQNASWKYYERIVSKIEKASTVS